MLLEKYIEPYRDIDETIKKIVHLFNSLKKWEEIEVVKYFPSYSQENTNPLPFIEKKLREKYEISISSFLEEDADISLFYEYKSHSIIMKKNTDKTLSPLTIIKEILTRIEYCIYNSQNSIETYKN